MILGGSRIETTNYPGKIKQSTGDLRPKRPGSRAQAGGAGTHLANKGPIPSYLGPCQSIAGKWRRKKRRGGGQLSE